MTPLQVVQQFMTHMEKLDYEHALALVTEDCAYINPPPIGAVRGPAEMRAVLQPFFAPTRANAFQTLRAAVDGGTVFLERLDRHQLADGWVELPVTGVFEVRDGQITYWRDYFDAATLLSQWPS